MSNKNGLILETSSEKSILILSQGTKVLAEKRILGGFSLSRDLLFHVEGLFREAKKNFEELSYVGIGIGPGSYTGIRCAASVGKSLSYALKIPLVPFCSLMSFVSPLPGSFTVLLDAKMGGIYTIKGRTEGEKVFFEKNPELISEKDSLGFLENETILVSPQTASLKKKFSKEFFEKKTWIEVEVDASYLASLVAKKFEKENFCQGIDAIEFLYF